MIFIDQDHHNSHTNHHLSSLIIIIMLIMVLCRISAGINNTKGATHDQFFIRFPAMAIVSV